MLRVYYSNHMTVIGKTEHCFKFGKTKTFYLGCLFSCSLLEKQEKAFEQRPTHGGCQEGAKKLQE